MAVIAARVASGLSTLTTVGYTKSSLTAATRTGATAANLLGNADVAATTTGTEIKNNLATPVDITGATKLLSAATSDSLAATPADGSKLTINGVDITFSTSVATKTGDATTANAAGSGLSVSPSEPDDLKLVDAAFSPDGRRVVTVDSAGNVQQRDSRTGLVIGIVLQAGQAPAGASQGGAGGLQEGGGLMQVDGGDPSPAQSPIQAPLTTTPSTAPSEPAPNTDPATDLITTARYSPDGTRLVTATAKGTLRIWESDTGRLMAPTIRTSGTGDADTSVLSPDGRWLATAQYNEVKLWDATTGEPAGGGVSRAGRALGLTFKPGLFKVEHLAFSPGGELLAARAMNAPIQFWNVATGERVGAPLGLPQDSGRIFFSADGRLLASAERSGLALASSRPSALKKM
eukprot:gene614-854_t